MCVIFPKDPPSGVFAADSIVIHLPLFALARALHVRGRAVREQSEHRYGRKNRGDLQPREHSFCSDPNQGAGRAGIMLSEYKAMQVPDQYFVYKMAPSGIWQSASFRPFIYPTPPPLPRLSRRSPLPKQQ